MPTVRRCGRCARALDRREDAHRDGERARARSPTSSRETPWSPSTARWGRGEVCRRVATFRRPPSRWRLWLRFNPLLAIGATRFACSKTAVDSAARRTARALDAPRLASGVARLIRVVARSNPSDPRASLRASARLARARRARATEIAARAFRATPARLVAVASEAPREPPPLANDERILHHRPRARKYGWGVPRLALLTLFAFEVVPRRFLAASSPDAAAAESLALAPYLASMRWLGHAYMGSIGAGVNVQVLGFLGNLAMLLLAAAACVWDVSHDYSILVYLVKTFSGDQLAGKLDTPEWKLVLLFTFGLFGPALWFAAGSNAAASDAARPYLRVLPFSS